MKPKNTIILSILALALCSALYAAPNQDNSIRELKTEISGIISGEVTKPTLDDLIKAIQQNDIKAVRTLINKGIDINEQLKDGTTPLIAAVKTKDIDIEIVKLLIRKKNINMYDRTGRDALIWAVKQHADIEIIKLLFEKGANLSLEDREGKSALWFAFNEKEKDIVLYLIEKGAESRPINGWSLVSLAAYRNWMEVVKAVVERGYPVNNLASGVHKPLDYAIVNKNVEMVNYLLEHNADVNSRYAQNTPLAYAVYHGSTNIARLLLEKGAKIGWLYWDYYDSLKTSDNDYPMLIFAAETGNKEMVKLLVEYGADVNEHKKQYQPFSALGAAAKLSNTEIAEFLIKKGANVNYQDSSDPQARYSGYTPLMFAVRWNKIAMVKLLIENGANVNAKDVHGNTALKIAREKGYKEIEELLRKNGARRWNI